jgi:hypothetical protein
MGTEKRLLSSSLYHIKVYISRYAMVDMVWSAPCHCNAHKGFVTGSTKIGQKQPGTTRLHDQVDFWATMQPDDVSKEFFLY